ncbi:DUF72 domain-containing protein [Pseudohaliea sp.]|uniref:DUF72 domain-containing protein n=1 Tax=Pseudohaliea sp. TaxID=2740289 RepID=UPI0032F03075
MVASPACYLGLPAWGFPGWTGTYFPRPEGRETTLSLYARVFNTVEGNTTFYRVPDRATAQRWAAAVAGTGFRFSFKLPRTLTHEARPRAADLAAFFDAMEVIGEHLGPLLVQCPATLGPEELPGLEALFTRLPGAHRYVLELRHPAFFTEPQRVEPLLERHDAGRVMFDSRPIYRGDAQHPEVLAARHRKPDVPLLDTVYNGLAYARVVLHPDDSQNGPWVEEWLARGAAYLEAGHTLYFMMHCPNNQHCPAFAERYHAALCERAPGLAPLPPWPLPQQPGLF